MLLSDEFLLEHGLVLDGSVVSGFDVLKRGRDHPEKERSRSALEVELTRGGRKEIASSPLVPFEIVYSHLEIPKRHLETVSFRFLTRARKKFVREGRGREKRRREGQERTVVSSSR